MKKSTKAVVAAAGVLTATNMVRAYMFKPEPEMKKDFPDEKVDAKRAQDNLSNAIKYKTISYPERELVDWEEFRKFHKFLEDTYPLITKSLTREIVDEACLVYCWKGRNALLEPIALLSHMDVVPVSSGTYDDWEHPAFEGYNDGEFIWGRGALDMKNHLICVMEAVETLLEEGFVPERDVYLLFGQDEEVVGSENSGAKAIMNVLKDRGVRLDSVLDEGGAVLPINVKGILNHTLSGIGIAEKGYSDIEISINTKGGHSSQPPNHTGLGQLADVIKDLENNQFKATLTDIIDSFIDKIGRQVSYPAKLLTCNLKYMKPLLLEVFKAIPPAASMVRTTTAVTMAQGSPAANVLPQKSSVVVNFRQMPGTTVNDLVAHIKKVVRNKNIEITVLKSKEASKYSPTDSESYKVIEDLSKAQFNNNITVPYLVMGGTDSCFYEPICDNIYRFSPFLVGTNLLLTTHATNERVPVSQIEGGVAFFKRYIRNLS